MANALLAGVLLLVSVVTVLTARFKEDKEARFKQTVTASISVVAAGVAWFNAPAIAWLGVLVFSLGLGVVLSPMYDRWIGIQERLA